MLDQEVTMTQDEAIKCVLDQWLAAVESDMGCKAIVDESEIEEYEWGWSFLLVPELPDTCHSLDRAVEIACERIHGISTPIGFLGLSSAVELIQRAARDFRERPRM